MRQIKIRLTLLNYRRVVLVSFESKKASSGLFKYAAHSSFDVDPSTPPLKLERLAQHFDEI